MTVTLGALLGEELATSPPESVAKLAAHLAAPTRDAAVLYYGSTLRTGDLSGILDFYRLTHRPHRHGLRGVIEQLLWPEVSYHEVVIDGQMLRAKVATLPFATFLRAARNGSYDTTIWARFVQPTQLVWADGPASRDAVVAAVSQAVMTAARFAAALGPDQGPAGAYWTALFRRTYAAEFRVESGGRADQVLLAAAGRYAALLPVAWREAGVDFQEVAGEVRPRKHGLPNWTFRSLLGKPLNLARLAKAAFTFEGAARYAAWKIERHTGIAIRVTPFRERHPILAAPGVLWQLGRAQAEARRGRLSNPNS